MLHHKKLAALCLSLALLMPGIGGTDDAMRATEAPPLLGAEWLVGEPLALPNNVRLTITGYETGARFRYYPSGGFSSVSLMARQGYRLLCLLVTVDNGSSADLDVSDLLPITLAYGADYESAARDTFFYRTRSGAFSGGAIAIRAGSQVEGCLLFAIPSEAETSGRRIAVTLPYGDETYACELRPGTALLLMDDSGEAAKS